MFKDFVNKTIFTENRQYIPNVFEYGSRHDDSFFSSVCALLLDRIKEDTITIKYVSKSYTKAAVLSSSAESVSRAICEYSPDEITDTIVIHNLGDHDSSAAILGMLREGFSKVHPGFVRLPKTADFYAKNFAVEAFINPTTKVSIVFVDSLNTRKFHALQTSIPIFMPWYFDLKEGLGDAEMALIQACSGTSYTDYIIALNKLAEKYNLRDMAIRSMLSGFESRYERRKLEELNNTYRETCEEIERLNNKIGNLIRSQRDTGITIAGLKEKINNADGSSEIMNYFLGNKALHLVNATDNYFEFAVDTYLEYFDPDVAERAITNERSFVYSGHNDSNSARMKKLMTELFLSDNPRMKIRFCAAYKIKLASNVSPCEHYPFGSGFENSMPNPHIDHYGCMGDYIGVINELVRNNDYMSAVAQCVASAMSLNFDDGYVMGEFMNKLWSANTKSDRFIELNDGTFMNVPEAIEWLEQQEETEHTNEVEESEEA